MKAIKINNIDYKIDLAGEGEPILLLHGFPDSSKVWRKLTPYLIDKGYKVIAPDLRGFGLTEAPNGKDNYAIDLIINDVLAILKELKLEKVKLIGHDWGAILGWFLVEKHPDKFENYIPISVGHPKAYKEAGKEQKKKAWYILLFQLKGISEFLIKKNNWKLFRKMVDNHPEVENWISDLSREKRLTNAINWYRANLGQLMKPEFKQIEIPVYGIWSSDDIALIEQQMVDSQKYVNSDWDYSKIENASHWVQLDKPKELSELILNYYEQ